MRSSVGGWLLKRDDRPAPENGFMMNMCAVAGLAASGTRFDAASIFRKASASPYGLPVICAPPASAENSREREIAIWISIAAIGARMIVASRTIGLPPRC